MSFLHLVIFFYLSKFSCNRLLMSNVLCFFFFQAEDGIRDDLVTGVQTCALPISLQTALLAIATTGTIIALYLLKLRHRRVVISSSILWRRVLDEQQSHSLWEKLRRILSIVIAVTIALLIALALARPEAQSLTGKNERIVIVLDTSPTMSTQT